MIFMKNLRFSSCLGAKVRPQWPLGTARQEISLGAAQVEVGFEIFSVVYKSWKEGSTLGCLDGVGFCEDIRYKPKLVWQKPSSWPT